MRMRTGLVPGWTAAAAALAIGVGAVPWLAAQQPTPQPQASQPAPAQPPAAQAPAPSTQTQKPSFRSGVEVVTVDVGVVDRQGLPLRGLTPADFTVSVAGRPRRVVTAEFVERHPPEAVPRLERSEVSSNEGGGSGRLFAFVVDQNTLDIGSARRVAEGAAPFFSALTYSDRSALLLMPLGPNVGFTWAHDRVQAGLRKVTGMGRGNMGWEYGSLSDARAISNRSQMAMRNVSERECGFAGGGGGGGGGSTSPGAVGAGASGGGGTAAGGGAAGGGAGGSSPTGVSPAPSAGGSGSRSASALDSFTTSNCARSIQMQAEATWRSAMSNSLASISSLRQFLGLLGEVRGEKTVILISGGWPLDERDEVSLVSQVAAEATAAHATIFSVFVPAPNYSADRRMITTTPLMDDAIHSGPLETLAGMTGGGSFRAEVGSDLVFARLARELSGYYRIGVEKEPSDSTASGRRMKVQVSRGGATIRAREMFDTPTYEDRDWAARLAAAIDGPVLATEVGLRVTTYLSADPDNSLNRRLLISGEATRAEPGNGTLHIVVNSLDGAKVTAGQVAVSNPGIEAVPFSMNIPVPPGSYIVRLGMIDSAGHVGSIDHRVDVRDVSLGAISATGPILLAVPGGAGGEPHLALDGVRQDERLAFEVDLEGPKDRLSDATVEFEIEGVAGGSTLLKSPGIVSPGPRDGTALAQGVSTVRGLPPGDYIIHAKIANGLEPAGAVSRRFSVIEGHRASSPVGTSGTASVKDSAILHTNASRMPVLTVEPFALDQVLTPKILSPFIERIAARPDSSDPAVRSLLEHAKTTGVTGLSVPETMTDEAAGAFLKGLTLLSSMKLEPAAASFRDAIKIAPDFYAAMVYLGACYAAGGKDKDAAAVWRTALIREGDAPELHAMLADAYLRQGRGDLAVADLDEARERWPHDMALKRRFAVAALMGGQTADGLQAVDELLDNKIQDEPSLAVAMLTIYEAFESGTPIETPDRDRARMLRLADAYKINSGPSQALVDAWVAAVAAKD